MVPVMPCLTINAQTPLSTGNSYYTLQAGLLTSGSFLRPRLPNSWSVAFVRPSVPGYSGGPVPDFHRIPSFAHKST
mgnify:CR=1 FL=1